MAETAVGAFFYFNGKLQDANAFDTTYTQKDPSVYEVLRIMDGKPLFLEEHYERLINSLASIGKNSALTLEELREIIMGLAERNGLRNNNVKLVMNHFEETSCDLYIYLIPTHYPSTIQYEEGVPTDLFSAVRDNPQAKIVNQSLRDATNQMIAEKKLFEVLLVNEENEITEGSRSNIFFLKGEDIYTAPAKGVLLGVTRQRILRICQENGISVKECPIRVSELTSYDAAFISGTSPKVLPISGIGEQQLDVNQKTLRRLMALYDQEITEYLLNK